MKMIRLLTFLLILVSCRKQEVQLISKNAEVYKDYISAYSSGFHRRSEPVRIEFAKPVIANDQIDKEVKKDIYKIVPELPGKCIWKSVTLLEFYPDKKALKGNTEYKLSIDLKTLFPAISEDLRQAAINFMYQPVELSVNWAFPRPSRDGKESMYLNGVLTSNDEVDPGKLSESISITTSDGKKIDAQWQVSATDPNKFDILISPIPRLKESTDLNIEWLTHLEEGSQSKEKKVFHIPSINEFAVQGTDESRISERDLSIYFSNILDDKQDIKGLVKFKDDSTVLQIVKDGDIVRIHFAEDWQKKSGILQVSHLIKSKEGLTLANDYEYEFKLIQNPPQVRFAHHGNILPYSKDIILPFEAINLHRVEVEIFKTFSNNVLYNMHLGYDEDYGSYNLVRLGRIIKQKVIELDDLSPGSNARDWKRYGLNLSELIEAEPGASYQVRICFKPEDTEFPCASGRPAIPEHFYEEESGDPKIKSFWRDYAYYDYSDYNSNDTKDPCNISYYYRDHFAKTTFFASNIAMIAKSSDDGGQSMAAVYDVLDGAPVKGAEVSFYDQQLQLLTKKETDGNGVVITELLMKPAYVMAKSGKHYSYLKIAENKSLSQSEFDISGVKIQEGLKSSIYTERGVWRPGDTIYLNAIINQISQRLPDQFPIELSVTNPQRQIIYKSNKADHMMGLYSFRIPTKETDLTGVYTAHIKAGLSVFEKNLLVETVKPNRFKVEWPEAVEYSTEDLEKGLTLKAMWLHGAPASNAQANISVHYKMIEPEFKKYDDYVFTDPESRSLEGDEEIFNEPLGPDGSATVNLPDFKSMLKCGKIKSTLISKIAAEDGDISTDYFETTVSPFDEYVGIRLPENPYGRQIAMGVDQDVQVVVLDKNGNAVANRELSIELFQVSYEWWYELRHANQGNYQQRNYTRRVFNNKIKTDQNGKAIARINVKEYDRFFIRATNLKNNYSSGDYFYSGWNYEQNNKEFVNILSFKTDKEAYSVGEKAKIDLPGSGKGNYLISLMRGNRILKTFTLDAKKDKTPFAFDLTQDMVPNIYVDVSFIQGKDGKKNDLPLRLYGVIPVKVEDQNKKLHPKINMNNQIRPDEKFTVEVSEENSREMVYQLFIVDEGLLNLTRFKTPNPYNDLLAREALSMMTWDNFNEVIGNMDGEIERVFSIGGDQGVNANQELKNKRFKPVVLKAGPIYLKKGEKQKHEFTMSNYIGAVRVMVIANEFNAFGSADKSVTVKNELMCQLTVPRVFAYNDEVLIPVTVFATDPKVKDVQINLEVKGKLKLAESGIKKIHFNQEGDQTVFYKVKGTNSIGNADLTVNATSGAFSSKNSVSLYVDNPNSISHEIKDYWVESGKSIKESVVPYGMEGTRKVKMEVSGFQGLAIDKMIDDLIHYPHGCLEQTTSSAFPQIYLPSLSDLSVDKKSEISLNVQAAIEKLRRFQMVDGAFSYWPGNDYYSDWANSYAGHFMIEAKNAGYKVPDDLLQKWYKSQRTYANSFVVDKKKSYWRPYFMQAYRLYTLSLFGKPEWGAMNQLYQMKMNDFMSDVVLAGAYAIGGKQDIALKLFPGTVPDLKYYRENEYSYGSNSRDEAMIAQVLIAMNKKNEAANLLDKLIRRNGRNYYYSTQEMAMTLVALGKLYGDAKDRTISFNYKWNEVKLSYETKFPFYMVDLPPAANQSFEFTNRSPLPVSVSIIQYGKEMSMANLDVSNGLKMKVSIGNQKDLVLNSGDEVNAIVNVTNTGVAGRIDNIALSAIFPSGFEIDNRRIGGITDKSEKVNYQDFRDDRVINYFGLNAGETITLKIPLTAAYAGQYVSPAFFCEAMYDPTIYAKYRSGSVNIKTRK